MADVLHRTTFAIIRSVNTPDFDVGTWVVNPDLAPVAGVAAKYWILTGDVLSVMDSAAQDVVDQAITDAANAAQEDKIKANMLRGPLEDMVVTVDVVGLTVTVSIGSVVADDVTTLVADLSDTKYLMLCYVFDEQADTLTVLAFTRTSGMYADLTTDQSMVKHLGEWSTPANGTTLTEVT